jgi:hypothetical protein
MALENEYIHGRLPTTRILACHGSFRLHLLMRVNPDVHDIFRERFSTHGRSRTRPAALALNARMCERDRAV